MLLLFKTLKCTDQRNSVARTLYRTLDVQGAAMKNTPLQKTAISSKRRKSC